MSEMIYFTTREGGEWNLGSIYRAQAYPRLAAVALRKGKTLYVYDFVLAALGQNPMRQAPAPQ